MQFKERKRLNNNKTKNNTNYCCLNKRGLNLVVLLNELVKLFPVQCLETEQSLSTLDKKLSMSLS